MNAAAQGYMELDMPVSSIAVWIQPHKSAIP